MTDSRPIILYVDIRATQMICEKYLAGWQEKMTIETAIYQVLPYHLAKQVSEDLAENNLDIIVSWVDSQTLENSEIGGVGNLEMLITPHFVISIVYEDEGTTEEQIDASIEWMLQNDH